MVIFHVFRSVGVRQTIIEFYNHKFINGTLSIWILLCLQHTDIEFKSSFYDFFIRLDFDELHEDLFWFQIRINFSTALLCRFNENKFRCYKSTPKTVRFFSVIFFLTVTYFAHFNIWVIIGFESRRWWRVLYGIFAVGGDMNVQFKH